MKRILVASLLLVSLNCFAQSKPEITNQFTVEGLVKNPAAISIAELSRYASHSIDSVVVKNHLMEKKYTMKTLKGVLLKDVLEKSQIDASSPKLLSEYYIVCIASDGYKVIFSWNEVFNSKNGENIYILSEHDGKLASVADDRIALISTSDYATGRRYVKWLQKIVVERVR